MRAATRAVLAAAALAAATPAEASDLRVPPPDPPRLGACGVAGGFRLPGTEGCLLIGGLVAAEAGWRLGAPVTASGLLGPATRATAPAAGRLDRPSIGASARLTADLRLPTDLGPVRVFVSLRGRNGAATDRGPR